MSRKISLLVFSLLCMQGVASEIHPFVRGFVPASLTVNSEIRGVSKETDYSTSFLYNGGAEFLEGTAFSPFYFGGGVGVMGPQNDSSLKITPWSAPIWASLSLRAPKGFNEVAPFVTLRAGWVMPLSTAASWWDSPTNYIVDAAIGIMYQRQFGIEASLTHLSLKKSYESKGLAYRIDSNRFGIAFFMNFELTHNQEFRPNEEIVEEEETEQHLVNTPVIKEISSEPVADKPAAAGN